ncbi:gallate 1-beta-glucosyltransferase-like [Cucurbita moschata]|uniref:Glycosyltransferase n=1 Tax=Cucurbita moschata TaxID=3662 RepID=A0A6J1EQ28_CUCMO|nr:gallate 1-beta-glucosyltransferase-like [Cucurbita moschata]
MSSKACLPHVFLVSFPGQGHINPMLRLGKKLAAAGLLVTFSTSAQLGSQMKNAGSISDHPTPLGNGFLRFEFFDDGRSDTTPTLTYDEYMVQLQRLGAISLRQILENQVKENRPVSCVIGNPFVPWVIDLADNLGISSAVFWVQSCSVFSVYYHHFRGAVPFPSQTQPNLDVELPFLPLLKSDEIPSFLTPNDSHQAIGKDILRQFSNLSKPFCILMDTFEELEAEVINDMSKKFPIKAVGPLFKICSDMDTKIRGDCMKAADECIEWLDSKPIGSVVYVSFGSVVFLKQDQIDEIAYALHSSGFSFLWVLKPPSVHLGANRHVLPVEVVEGMGERGKVVEWSPQERVLSHPSLACFLTHCGWNSSVEAMSLGVPMVAFPQWGDQVTNAKFLVDVFGVGLRLSRGANEDRLIQRDEIEKCLREAMEGPRGVEIRQNALKQQKAAEKAVADGGSSDRNIKDFIDEIRKR